MTLSNVIWGPIPKGTVVVAGATPAIHRVGTGLYGLDQALAGPNGEPGLPIRGGIEIYGRWETGKSTLAYYLSGRVAPEGRIVLVDFEGGARSDYLETAVAQSGFHGSIYQVPYSDKKGEPRTHESMLTEGADSLLQPDVVSVILDSAAMTRPVMEKESEDMEESFMGRRAQVLAKFSRRFMPNVNFVPQDKLVIIVNHMLQDMGGYGKISPGGDTLKFGIHARLWIRRAETLKNMDGAFEAEVTVEKLRFGGRSEGRTASVIIVPGLGVSPELTALFDLMSFKEKGEPLYAKRRSGYAYIKKGDNEWERIGTMSSLFNAARSGDSTPFYPVYERLNEVHDEQLA